MTESTRPPPALGGLPGLGQTVPFLRDPLGTLSRWGHRDEDVLRVTVAGREFCLVSDPALVRSVLATNADRFRKAQIVREKLGTLQGNSLVLLEGEEWRDRRRLLRDGFGGEQVRATGELTTERARETVAQWPTEVRADEEMQSLTLSILARALFGLDLQGTETPIHQAADAIMARMTPGGVSLFLPEWVPTPTNYRYKRAVQTLHDRLDDLVADAADSPE